MGLYDEGAYLILTKSIEDYYLFDSNAKIYLILDGDSKTFDLGEAENIDTTFSDDGNFYILELTGEISWPVSEGDIIEEIQFSRFDGVSGVQYMYYVFDEPIEAPADTDFNLNKFTVKIPYDRISEN